MALNKNIKSVYIEFMTLGDEINHLVLLFICSMLHFIIRCSFSSVFNEYSESKNQYFLIWKIRVFIISEMPRLISLRKDTEPILWY